MRCSLNRRLLGNKPSARVATVLNTIYTLVNDTLTDDENCHSRAFMRGEAGEGV